MSSKATRWGKWQSEGRTGKAWWGPGGYGDIKTQQAAQNKARGKIDSDYNKRYNGNGKKNGK